MVSDATMRFSALGAFYGGWITDVLLLVKSGKEASVYCCRAHPATGRELIAAKVYRPIVGYKQNSESAYQEAALRSTFERKIKIRTFKNDALYQEGRTIADARMRRAFENKSKLGRAAQHASWVEHEYQTLRLLHDAGAGVVQPLAQAGDAMLMEYVGDDLGPAQTLHQTDLKHDEVEPLFQRLLRSIYIGLTCGRVHGDLSPFNILYWRGELKLIDFPQAVDAYLNSNAYYLLQRDVRHVCRYFGRYGLHVDPSELAEGLWSGKVQGAP